MPNYCVNSNAQTNGDHEVHDLASTKGCLPSQGNQVGLGYFGTCRDAVAEARRRGYRPANGCAWCVPACHTS